MRDPGFFDNINISAKQYSSLSLRKNLASSFFCHRLSKKFVNTPNRSVCCKPKVTQFDKVKMSGCATQHWVSYAGDDSEAWKCLLLARALNRSLTTRPLVVILSDGVSRDLGRRLQGEVGSVFWTPSVPGLAFSSVAKRMMNDLPQLTHSVFLDCATLPLKNCDDLFTSQGVQWVSRNVAALLVKPRTISGKNWKKVTDLVVERENSEVGMFSHDFLQELDYCWEVDVKSPHPTLLPGEDAKLLCFTNGHPLFPEGNGFRERGALEKEIFQLCISLCPEMFPNEVDMNPANLPAKELNDSIAIIGMACRYPCANTPEEFWTLLANGLEGIRKVPGDRWTKESSLIRLDNVRNVEAGFLSCPIDTFDAGFFKTNAADMALLDPQQRLSLRVVWEGLENAGIDPNTLQNSLTGVFGGWWRNDYKEMLQHVGILETDFLRGYMGNALGPLTARISHFFELIGPSISTESGCSTSIAGVDMACDRLRKEDCNLAIAVAANLLLHPFTPKTLEGVLAPDGRCKTYDAAADGFGRAEGVGVLILKRFGDAVAAGDKIWGLIRGSAIVQEGTSRSMGTPTVDVEAKAMTLALQRAGVDPDDVEFVETHGTGTPIGDPIEIAAVCKAYSGSRKSDNVLTIGSVKTNIGHTESVCGIAGIQKSILSMEHELIPKHLNMTNLNPEINLASIPAQLPLDPIPWKRRLGGKPRIAGINSFGITGAQAHILVQEPPESLPSHRFSFTDSRPLRMLTFSAKTEEAFHSQIKSYTDLLQSETCPSLRDIEYSMHTTRSHFPLRQVALGSSKDELLKSMQDMKAKQVPNMPPKLCFLFTGQGSQYAGMAKALYEGNLVFQSNFDWCDSILRKEHGYSLKQVLWDPSHEALLKSCLYSQTSIFVIELCLLRLWESWGIVPDAVLGHSLGEFAAAVAAGMISPKDALKLVVTRANLINALPSSAMLVVGASLDKVQQNLEHAFVGTKNWLDIAALNSESQTVVSGPTELIQQFKLYCDNNDLKTHVLDASHAFHSRLMDPMLQEYEAVAASITFKESKSCHFISGLDGRVVTKLDAKYWVRHTRERVRFLEASHAAVKEGQELFLEIGPHPVLSALLLTNVDEIADVTSTPSLRKKSEDWDTMLTSLGKLYSLGRPINWENFHRYTGGVKVPLPGYYFKESKHWLHIKDDGYTPFHPLLGAFVPNPSDVTIFKNNVNVHHLPFLKDHSLGDKIIFPCVGYVDMLMTAGYAATLCDEGTYTKPSSPLAIRNFSIATPVCLSEMSPTEFQVVVSKTPEGETSGTIFTKVFLEDKTHKWVRNAIATFSRSPPPVQASVQNPESFPQIQSRCSELLHTDFDYGDLEEFGFNFGPSCRTVSGAWKNPDVQSGEWIFKFGTHESPEDHERFIIHPWVTDPMLQTQIIASGLLHDKQVRKRLVVPVSIDNFTWWGHSAPKGFVYIKNGAAVNEAHIFDDDGKLMVSMIGTEYMDTTLSNIMALIDSQKNPYPSMAEYVWRERLGPEERRVPDGERGSIGLQQFLQPSEPFNKFTLDEEEFYDTEHVLCELYILKACRALGLDSIGKEFTWPQIVEDLRVLPSLSKFFRYILHELVKDGWLVTRAENVFQIVKSFPEAGQIRSQITTFLEELKTLTVVNVDYEALSTVWEVLDEILTGKVDALPLLFPEGTNTLGPAEAYYTSSLVAKKRHAMTHVDSGILATLAGMGTKSVVRILEVGAGIGSTTSQLIPQMVAAGVTHFEYTYTDLSPSFLQKGETLFEETGISAKFALLNVEKDPLEQGFIPGHYDVVVASWVLHATKSIEESVANLKKLLKPGGYVLITELTSPTRPINLLYGGLEGFWRFEDTQLRPWNCELSIPDWERVLWKSRFEDVVTLPICGGTNAYILAKVGSLGTQPRSKITKVEKLGTWLVFGNIDEETEALVGRLEDCDQSAVIISRAQIGDGEQMEEKIGQIFTSNSGQTLLGVIYLWGLDKTLTTPEVCQPFLYICKNLIKSVNLRIVTFTQGNLCTGSTDFFQSTPSASPVIAMLNVLANENPDLTCKAVDLDGNPAQSRSSAVSEAFTELFLTDPDVMVAFRKGQRCTPRIRPYKVKSAPLPIPRSPRFQLLLPPSLLIQDLQFGPCEPQSLAENEVEIEVKAYALNFLDVFMVTKPDPVFDKYNYLGVDIAGVVTAVGAKACRKIGDRVVMIRRHGQAMPSHIVFPDYRTLLLPDDITFAEASTLPMGLLTVSSCLLGNAKAQKDDIVLIHTASGGVGLVGIQVAQRLGCTIVVTAGNERKRNYLRSLGLTHVFNSRTTEYETDIRKALGGRGVTVVLNSLTGSGFKEATLALCEPGARFIEMSKMNIWSKEEVAELRPDVYYDVVDVSTHSEEEITELSEYMQEQLMLSLENRLKPLPFIRFDASEIRDALEHMEKVRHIGKIVLIMPEPGLKSSSGEPVSPLFNGMSTYLISGGLGGIGLEVADWMASSGARTVLLLGRSPPKPEALDKIEKLRGSGVRVEIRCCDVGDWEQIRGLRQEFESGSLPPLRGINHAAGLLDDGTYEDQTWAKYEGVFNCKINGAWNLHQLSLIQPYPLEHFVLFSSVTATVGAHGQSNYVAGNQYLDSLVHYRASLGLPGTTINWGQWGQVGLASNLVVPFNKPLTIHQGLAALEHALKSHRSQVVAHETDFAGIKQIFPSLRGLLADIEEYSGAGTNEIDGDEFWREYDSAEGRDAKLAIVKKFLKRLTRYIMKMDKNEEIDDHVSFQDLGMDSLMMVEMKNGLQTSVGKRIKVSIAALKDCKTVQQLSERLVELISGKEEAKPLPREDLVQLIAEDSVLPAHINLDSLTSTTEMKKLSQISTIFITGATGTLGPYVLIELLKLSQVQKIYVLMKGNKLLTPENRFGKILSEKNLLQFIDLSKLSFLTGDVSQEHFGLSQETYHLLGTEIDAIFHLAVQSGWDEFYQKSSNPNHPRTVNVSGMKNILDFTTQGKLKYLYHASTLLAESRLDHGNRFLEDWPLLGEFDNAPDSAYPISKYVCDRLAGAAVAAGVPIKAFRFPYLGGDASTGGNFQILNSQLMMRMLGYMYLGFMPAVNMPMSILPVDLCAKYSVQLFFNEAAGFEMYNLGNPQIFDELDFEDVAATFGVEIEVVEPAEFTEKIKNIESKDTLIDMARSAIAREPLSKRIEDGDDLPEFYVRWMAGDKDFLVSRKMTRFFPEEYPSTLSHSVDVLTRDLQFARDDGIFDKFGIKCDSVVKED